MKKITCFTLVLTSVIFGHAQLKEGKKNIDKFCGCFHVDFKYAETFSPDEEYKYKKREHLEGLELGLLVEKTDKKIVIQHLLIVGDSTIVKHWREDWEFESPYIWNYEGDKKWVKQQLKPEQYKNKWTQTIWEVDDAPRYQGIGEWVTTDGKTFWQNTTNAPLPRREYKSRADYNILRRGNRLILTDTGWVHEQDNDKIAKKDGVEKLVVQEKGYNTYTLRDAKDCVYANAWWNKHSVFWSKVRAEWESLIKAGNTINLASTVGDKPLREYLLELSNEYDKKELAGDLVSTRVKAILQKFASVNADVANTK